MPEKKLHKETLSAFIFTNRNVKIRKMTVRDAKFMDKQVRGHLRILKTSLAFDWSTYASTYVLFSLCFTENNQQRTLPYQYPTSQPTFLAQTSSIQITYYCVFSSTSLATLRHSQIVCYLVKT